MEEDGRISGILDHSRTECTKEDLESDAKLWATHFSYDARNNHCSNHEHDCKETCVKYVKKNWRLSRVCDPIRFPLAAFGSFA